MKFQGNSTHENEFDLSNQIVLFIRGFYRGSNLFLFSRGFFKKIFF